MKTARWMAVALLGLATAAAPARAATISPNGAQVAAEALAGNLTGLTDISGALVANFSHTENSLTLAGTLTSQVYRIGALADLGANAIQLGAYAGGIAIVYQIDLNSDNTTFVQRFTATLYNNSSNPSYVAHIAGTGDVAPTTADWDGVSLGFSFPTLVSERLDGTEQSVRFLFATNAPSYAAGLARIQDGVNVMDIPTFVPSPEPSTLALAGLALPLVGLGYLRRRRQA